MSLLVSLLFVFVYASEHQFNAIKMAQKNILNARTFQERINIIKKAESDLLLLKDKVVYFDFEKRTNYFRYLNSLGDITTEEKLVKTDCPKVKNKIILGISPRQDIRPQNFKLAYQNVLSLFDKACQGL